MKDSFILIPKIYLCVLWVKNEPSDTWMNYEKYPVVLWLYTFASGADQTLTCNSKLQPVT